LTGFPAACWPYPFQQNPWEFFLRPLTPPSFPFSDQPPPAAVLVDLGLGTWQPEPFFFCGRFPPPTFRFLTVSLMLYPPGGLDFSFQIPLSAIAPPPPSIRYFFSWRRFQHQLFSTISLFYLFFCFDEGVFCILVFLCPPLVGRSFSLLSYVYFFFFDLFLQRV